MRRRGPSSSGQWCAGRLAEKRGSFSEASRYILSTHCTGNITNLDASNLSTGSVPDARVPASNVTQHEAALTILKSQVTDF